MKWGFSSEEERGEGESLLTVSAEGAKGNLTPALPYQGLPLQCWDDGSQDPAAVSGHVCTAGLRAWG